MIIMTKSNKYVEFVFNWNSGQVEANDDYETQYVLFGFNLSSE
jgi:hypothetical protein